jgi:hypothetical protein
MSAQSIGKAKRSRVVTTLETKLKIIRNVETDFLFYKEVVIEMKKARIQPNLDYFLKTTDDSQPSVLHFKFLE